MRPELVDLETIARAVGVPYRTVAENWTSSPAWPPHHDRAGLGGAKRWRVQDLPTAFVRRGKVIDVRRAVELHLAVEGARAAGWLPVEAEPATPNIALATRDVAPSSVLPAPGGEPIRAGLPSPALSVTAPSASGVGGLTGGGGAGGAFAPGGSAAVPAGYLMAAAPTGAASTGNGPLTRGAGSIPAAPATFSVAAPAASGMDGFAGGGGAVVETADAVLIGMIDGRTPREDDFERVQQAE